MGSKINKVGNPILRFAPNVEINGNSQDETPWFKKNSRDYESFLIAAPLISKDLKKQIIRMLSLLDEKEMPSYFWEEFFKEKLKIESQIHKWTAFLNMAIGEEKIKYANRFPVLFSMYKKSCLARFPEKEYLTAADIVPATVECPPHGDDMRWILFPAKDSEIDNHSSDQIPIPICMFDNLYEPLAYILLKSQEWKAKVLEDFLKKSGYTIKSAKEIIKKAAKLHEDIEEHRKRKMSYDKEQTTSIPNITECTTYYKFWHKECAKRKFYLDYEENKDNLQEKLFSCLEYLNALHDTSEQVCSDCLFKDRKISVKDVFISKLSFKCEISMCSIKERMCTHLFEVFYDNKDKVIKDGSLGTSTVVAVVGLLKEIYEQYACFLPDLLLPHSAQGIFDHNKKHNNLPYEELVLSKIRRHEFSQERNELSVEFVDENYYKSHLEYELAMVEEKIKDGKQRINSESFMIGLYIWDEKHVLQKQKSISKIIEDGMSDSGFFSSINQKQTQAELPDIKYIRDNCRRHYVRVCQSINNVNSKLLSIENTMKRPKLRIQRKETLS